MLEKIFTCFVLYYGRIWLTSKLSSFELFGKAIKLFQNFFLIQNRFIMNIVP